jgi:hypothetical protein
MDISFDRVRGGIEDRIGNEAQYSFRMGIRDFPISYGDDNILDILELNSKVSLRFGYKYGLGRNGHAIIFDIGMLQKIKPSLVSPFSRIIATTITLK